MKALCFALILSQLAQEKTFPPKHIQDLLKNRVLHQIKQGNPDLMFNFDDPTCTVIGSYNYIDESLEISSNDKSIQLKLPFSDILEGRTLELNSIGQLIEAKENVIAAHTTLENEGNSSQIKKWLPWVAGAVGLGIGGIVFYNSMGRGSGDGGNSRGTRSYK
jgi:hypothetical protein